MNVRQRALLGSCLSTQGKATGFSLNALVPASVVERANIWGAPADDFGDFAPPEGVFVGNSEDETNLPIITDNAQTLVE